jgi:hypothetical protein
MILREYIAEKHVNKPAQKKQTELTVCFSFDTVVTRSRVLFRQLKAVAGWDVGSIRKIQEG